MSLVIATICEEGIALAADTKLTLLLKRNDPETGEEVEVTSWFSTSASKMVLTDNNVGIAFVGRLTVKGLRADLFFSQYFAQRPRLNARQVAEEINRLFVQEPELGEMEVLVAGMMDARCKIADGSTVRYKRPWLFELSTAMRGKIRKYNQPGANWMGEGDIVERLLGRHVKVKRGRKKVQLCDFDIPYTAFTLQDAIDFSTIWLEMSYRLMRFQDREHTVGPPIEVMVIDKDGASFS